ncbi:hypothetical protein [Saccharopolyspora sp. ASAGF58]|uniref:hypothetical protein n=1 Tax=Saccharopolyspora sp. ASAGF58 TaxID=2719023 RepID=UPI001B303AE9|nr:hypothetical protein [Saccharopolyspora sp. ASAGF58]
MFVAAEQLEPATAWYERLLGVERDMFMPYPEKDLALAAVGGFLIIAGPDEALAPFRQTVGTLLVADVGPYEKRFRQEGLDFIQERFRAPSGEGFTVRRGVHRPPLRRHGNRVRAPPAERPRAQLTGPGTRRTRLGGGNWSAYRAVSSRRARTEANMPRTSTCISAEPAARAPPATAAGGRA